MQDEPIENENFYKLLDSISNDLFLLKLEMKIIRIDELLDNDNPVWGNDEIEDNLHTPFQRMFFCKNWLKRHIFWAGDEPDGITKAIDQLFNNFFACEGLNRSDLENYTKKVIKEREKDIKASKDWIINEKKDSDEYRKIAMDEFQRETKGLSRIEALFRLNRIQWRIEVLEQMGSYFKQHNNLDHWKYEMPFNSGCKDERPTLDF